MPLVIEDDALEAGGVSAQEAREILAIGLYERGRLSFGSAARLAGADRLEFQKLLGAQHIPLGPSVADLDREVEALRKLGLL